MKQSARNSPTRISARKIIAAMAGGAFLILLIAYLAAISESTGYEEFARQRRRPAVTTQPSSTEEAASPATAAEPADRTPSATPPEDTSSSDAGRRFELAIVEASTGTGNQLYDTPILDMTLPYYREGAIYPKVSGFDPANARAVLEREAQVGITETLEKEPHSLSSEKKSTGDPAKQIASARVLLDAVERIYLEAEMPPPEPRVISGRNVDWLNQQACTLFLSAILRSEFRGDHEASRRHVPRALMLDVVPVRNRLYTYAYNAAPRLEILALLATERGIVEPETLARVQEDLMLCRHRDEDLDDIRTDVILQIADAVCDEPDQWLMQKQNVWPHFLSGYPRDMVASVMKPVFRKRVEEYAMAVVEHDQRLIDKAGESLWKSGNWMNYDQPGSPFQGGQFFEIDRQRLLKPMAPILFDPASYINNEVDSAILVLASCRYRLERGEWPASPEVLISDHLDRVVLDESLQVWDCAMIPLAGREERSFAIVRSGYNNVFRLEDGTFASIQEYDVNDPVWTERLRTGPASIQIKTHVNLLPLYEPDFRRLLAPETVEKP